MNNIKTIKPKLVILAAGMGSRYGGLKQIDPVGPNGELIIDYSIYDALKAGFEQVICIIKRDMTADFNEVIGNRVSEQTNLKYAYQELDDLPLGFTVPEGRVKPWGTTHALLSAKQFVDGPFAVINADDYYGPQAFKTIFDWLTKTNFEDDKKMHYAMVGYLIENTLTEHGSVARGLCVENNGFLERIVERRNVEKTEFGARFSEDNGDTWTELPPSSLVSMNFWGFTAGIMDEAGKSFPVFLEENINIDPLRCEHLLPSEIDRQIQLGLADVEVLKSNDVWYGVTYKEDKPRAVEAFRQMQRDGVYPADLWIGSSD
jgi:NDP-sugar pyrophosphorylase family protein